jgi:hypothetical protein
MARLNRGLAAAIIGLACTGWPQAAQAQQFLTSAPSVVHTSLTLPMRAIGAISGVVSDERGGPLAGAMVSVHGEKMAVDVTDAQGRFSLENLPAGEYILRAHRAGFAMSRSESVRIGSGGPASYRLQLRRLDGAVGTSGSLGPVSPRPILTAGLEVPGPAGSDPAKASAEPADEDHPHTETAWRLRHLPRSILKDSIDTIPVNDDDQRWASIFGRAVESASNMASLFADLPFTGEVNLLTTSAMAPGEFFSTQMVPRGVAYLSLGAPTPAGDWSLRAAMSQGDLSSWIVASSFVSHRDSLHSYDLGFSYSTQEYQGGNPLTLATVTDGSRNVGEIYAVERWTLPRASFEYGGRYARYDYLRQSGLLSPRASITIEPVKGTRVVTTVAQRMVAPGAEEFLSPQVPGPWLPPERTFSAFGSGQFVVERARSVDVRLEHDFDQRYVLSIRRFVQDTSNQLATLFGVDLPGGPRSIGHYYVAGMGGVQADGWGFRLSSPPSQRMRAAIDYTMAHTEWGSRPSRMRSVRQWAPGAIRPDSEDIHDVTTSFETDIPETATRVFVLYKVNTAFTRDNPDFTRPGLDARFDLQVNQALPFGVGSTHWEVLLGVRNLFRDPNDPASVYDELLVVRPPKRVVGGVLVRF